MKLNLDSTEWAAPAAMIKLAIKTNFCHVLVSLIESKATEKAEKTNIRKNSIQKPMLKLSGKGSVHLTNPGRRISAKLMSSFSVLGNCVSVDRLVARNF